MSQYPEWAGDPRNITFMYNRGSGNEHVLMGHGGSFSNPTTGNLIDRAMLIAKHSGN